MRYSRRPRWSVPVSSSADPRNKPPSADKGRCRRGLDVRVFFWLMIAVVGFATAAQAAWVRPLEGSGNFHCMIDMYSRQSEAGTFDIVLLISVANREWNRFCGTWGWRWPMVSNARTSPVTGVSGTS